MIQLKNITITHKMDLRVILNDFSMVLNDGDKAVIIGEEGNGKSTLLKLIYNPELVEDYVEYSGEIILNNAKLGYLAQELSAEHKAMPIYDFCQESERFFMLTPKELADIAHSLSIPVDIYYSDQLVDELSGGEKVKLQLARILMDKPDVLLLDEPSNDIDLQTLEWLEKFICEEKLPILYISHDETLLERTANKIVHIEQIKRKTATRYTVIQSNYRDYVEKRADAFTRQEQQAKNERKEYEKQQERFHQVYQKVEHQQKIISRQAPLAAAKLAKKIHTLKAQESRYERAYENMTDMPESEDAIFIKFGQNASIPNGKVVLNYELDKLCLTDNHVLASNIKLRITGPKHVCIIGKNGIGKTTLIRKIAKEMLSRNDIKAYYMPQNYEEELDFDVTPVEFLSVTGDKDEVNRIRTYLGCMKYTADEMLHPIRELSGGQKAKVLLLKISMMGYDVLILDEPTRNFSPLSAPVIRGMLRNFGGTIISVSHDRKYIGEVCDVVYELDACGLHEI